MDRLFYPQQFIYINLNPKIITIMKKLFIIITTSILTAALSATAAIVDETWADGSHTNQDLANNSMAWFSSAGGGNISTSTGSMTQNGGGRHIIAYFTDGAPLQLGLNQALTINFAISFDRDGAFPTDNDFRMGAWNSGGERVTASNHAGTSTGNPQSAFIDYTGYIFSGGLHADRSISIRKKLSDSDPILMASTGVYSTLGSVSTGTHSTLAANESYTGTLSITRTAADAVEVHYVLRDDQSITMAEITRQDNSGAYISFDTVGFWMGSSIADSFTLTQVEVIPEPRYYAMIFGGLALAFLMRRRRLH